jgi:hypothetical protein
MVRTRRRGARAGAIGQRGRCARSNHRAARLQLVGAPPRAQALSQLPGMEPDMLADMAARQTDPYAADMLRQILAERCAR